jgi:Ca-activated chloride channel family protein
MNHGEKDQVVLAYLTGELTGSELKQFEAQMVADPKLRQVAEQYRSLLEAEKSLAKEQYELMPNFSVKVMEAISASETTLIGRLYMLLTQNRRIVAASLATCATLVLVLRLRIDNPNAGMLDKKQVEQSRELVSAYDAQVFPPAVPKSEDAAEMSQSKNAVKSEIATDQGKSGPVVPEYTMKESPSKQRDLEAAELMVPLFSQEGGKTFGADRQPSVASDLAAPAVRNQKMAEDKHTAPARVQQAESYIGRAENGSRVVRNDPVSTFSIDVDTASYANVRRFIQAGSLPPVDAVRTEELLNYFEYNYPVQSNQPFTLSYEIAPSPLEPQKLLLKLGIKARSASEQRKPWNLVLLVDVSGSMAEQQKLPLLKAALPLLVEKMTAQDSLSIVTYAGKAGVLLPSTSGNNSAAIYAAIRSLGSAGGTNGAGGINVAYDVAQRAFIKDGVNRVILMTDGDFNVGITDRNELLKLIEYKRRTGITLTAIGVGTGNLNDGTIEQLANKGNGNYFYLDTFKEARRVLSEQLVSNVEVVARDVKFQVEFNPQQISQYRLIGYENRTLQREEFNADAIDAGEIGPGHSVTALYELVPTGPYSHTSDVDALRYQASSPSAQNESGSQPRDTEVGFLKIRFKEAHETRSELREFKIKATDIRTNWKSTTDDFRFAAAVAYFAQSLRTSSYSNNLDLEQVLEIAQGALGADRRGERREFLDLVRSAQAIRRIN